MRRPRRSLITVVLLMTVIAGGCAKAPAGTAGSDGGSGSLGGTTMTGTRDQAVAFAACMRTNGVSTFPDPDASGELTLDGIANGANVDVSSAAFTHAVSACKDLEPAGFTGHARTSQQQEEALAFARCIRDNGVKDFPDPDPDAPLVDTNRIPSSSSSGGMSALHAAMQTCGHLVRDLVKGP